MRVSLAPLHLRPGPTPAPPRAEAPPLLSPAGARVMLGGGVDADGLVEPIAPGPATMFGPRGACVAGNGGLFVCDTGHHRLLAWRRIPETDHAPADFLIGQRDFSREGRNAKGEIGSTTLNVPTGVAADDDVLAVADAWNHRVLIWRGLPDASHRPANVVLGQSDFNQGLANRGADHPGADTLHWCYGVTIADGGLIVADTGNRRVLVWNEIPSVNGAPADLVLGQRDPRTRDENAGEGGGARGMRWPHAVAAVDGSLFVADAGNNRIMAWRRWPSLDGAPCDYVLGQTDASGLDHNRAAYFPTARAMSMPYGVCAAGKRLIVADTANSRLLGFEHDRLGMGVAASRLAGQISFEAKGDNRWTHAERDSLCWPYNVSARGDTLVIANSGNNRVLLWEAAP